MTIERFRPSRPLAGMIFPFLLALGVPGRGVASMITYDVSQTIGDGTVTGTIQTDGATGTLTAADFTDWDLLLADGLNTITLLGPVSGDNSVIGIFGTDVTATSTDLFFNFSGSDNGYLIFQLGSLFTSASYWCSSAGTPDICGQGETDSPGNNNEGGSTSALLTGNDVIGTAETSAPEPGAVFLFSGGLAICLYSKRKFSRLVPGKSCARIA